MIKSTFGAYKARFKELLVVLKPLIVVELMLLMLSILGGVYGNDENYFYLIAGMIIVVAISFLQIFVYTPAAFRTIQKREIGESITMEEAIAFQKVNKWKFFKVTFWIGLWSLGYGLATFLPLMIGVGLGIIISSYAGVVGIIVGILFGLAGIATAVMIAYRLYPRIFFALNIYLVKDKSGQDAIAESTEIGNAHTKEIWKFVLGVLMINLISFVLVMIVVFPLMYPELMAVYANPDIEPEISFAKSTIASFWQSAVGLFFVLPMTYLYLSKAYAKIRTVTEPQAPHTPEVTVAESTQ